MSNYSRIIKDDISNGPGFRCSIFISGCPGVIYNVVTNKYDHCDGCFNSETWNFKSGKQITQEVIDELIKNVSEDYVQGLSILGGEPLCRENQEIVYEILCQFRNKFEESKDVWIWTGYYLHNVPKTKFTKKILKMTDVIVDGPFFSNKFDIDLKYRGSSNQNVIYLKK